jgi:predicted esterase
MDTKRWMLPNALEIVGVCAILLALAGCGLGQAPDRTQTLIPPTNTPAHVPTLSLEETKWVDFPIPDLDAVHAQVPGDPNKYLIFGNLPVSTPSPDLPPELAAFLGRWEGFDYSPPVKKDNKGILFIQEISPQGGKAFLWAGTNLQYPYWIKEVQFRVAQGAMPSIEWECDLAGPSGMSGTGTFRFVYDRENQLLKGGINVPSGSALDGPSVLSRDQSFFVYKDYGQYLGSNRIYSKEYQNTDLQKYGRGYLVYRPDGYEDHPKKTWPLLFFLHGSGDRGDNTFLLAKASPFMMIREKGPLPFIIVAPLLNAANEKFPLEYLDGVLAEAQATYRVDPKRIYVTGLSLGGEATYRFAIHQPDTFAAIAPLSAWLDADQISLLDRIKNLPVWAIHGAEDTIIALSLGQQPVEALKKLGGNIRFTILEGHDHDTWTDTYSDPAFYDWFLQHQKP